MSVGTNHEAVRAANALQSGSATRRNWTRYSNRTFYLFIAPWLLGFIGLGVIPLAYALAISFTNFDGMGSHWRWIGLDNYTEALSDPDVWYSLSRTLLYMVITVPLGVFGGLGLALLLNKRMRGVGLFRTVFYLPSIVPVVAVAVLWRIVFDRDAGILNALIEMAHGPTIAWLIDPTAFIALIIMVLWGLGGGTVIFLAGLQGVPAELKEAAAIDGANGRQAFRAVTLPLLTPVLLFTVITGAIGALQTFIQPLLLTTGGSDATYTTPRTILLYMIYAYQQFFNNQRFGYGSALLWVLFMVVLVITLVVFRSSSMWVYYEVAHEKEG